MTQIASLPSISVSVAFSPTNIFSPTQTWTDVTAQVQSLQTSIGRQHMLDRFESGTLKTLVNNRSGFFTTTNQVRARLPIKVSATWSGTTYPIFYGLIDEPDLKQHDQLNVDYQLQASDYLKMLSLTYMERPNYYGQFVNTGSGNALNWYRMDSLLNPVIGAGSAFTNTVADSLGTANGQVQGAAATTSGVLVYDTSVAVDLTNGTGNPSAFLNLTSAATQDGASPTFMDLWVVGLNCNNSVILPVYATADYSLRIDPNGFLYANGYGTVTNTVKLNDGNWHHVAYGYDFTTGYRTVVLDGTEYQLDTNPISISDNAGQIWIGSADSSGSATGVASLAVYADEVVLSTNGSLITNIVGNGTTATVNLSGPIRKFTAGSTVTISGNVTAAFNGTWTVVTGGTSSFTFASSTVSTGAGGYAGYPIVSEIQNRYTAGTRMLTKKSSADMVNDILQVAGLGSFPYKVDYGTYTAGSWQGVVNVNGWASTVTNSTALDLILLVCDTECGAFFQDQSGTFQFLTRDYQNLPANLTPVATFTDYDNGYSNQVFYTAPELQVLEDDMDLWTTVKVTPTNGQVQRYDASTATENLYGGSTLTKSTQPPTLADALGEAQYWGYIYGEPLTRVGSVMLGSETNNGGQLPIMLNANIFQRTTFVYRDPAGTVTSAPMLIESFSHEFDSEASYWHTSFVLDPYPVSNSEPFLIWDNGTYGVWDTDLFI